MIRERCRVIRDGREGTRSFVGISWHFFEIVMQSFNTDINAFILPFFFAPLRVASRIEL